MNISGYSVFIGFMILFALLVFSIPQENSFLDPVIDNNSTDNFTNTSQPADENPMMSTPDNVESDEKGWWKHEGHSTVNTGNSSASGSNDNKKEDNNDNNDSEEIPEFPGLAVPFIVTIGIAMFFGKK
ncbi:hypothetical protein [uncultured Methanolobus sp.]|uniref:hypothetical protein n=1 Tax=uncultured Methanolobus sp. TaxID=218300 RepID=UPI002AAB0429|nr:hypothetical protein [uncultured Methanolobus sp.]